MNSNFTTETDEDEYPEITQADLDRAVFRQGLEATEKKQCVILMLDDHIIEYFKEKELK